MKHGSPKICCPNCDRLNDAAWPPAQGARCVACGADLHPLQPFALHGSSFAMQIRRSEVPILVHYWANWCAPCRMLRPIFEQAAVHRRGLRFASCDVDVETAPALEQDIGNLPTLVLYAPDREPARISGTMRLSALLDWIDFQLDAAHELRR